MDILYIFFIWVLTSLSTLYRSYHDGVVLWAEETCTYSWCVKVLYCKLPTINEQLPTFPHRVRSLNHQPQRWEVRVLLLCQCGPHLTGKATQYFNSFFTVHSLPVCNRFSPYIYIYGPNFILDQSRPNLVRTTFCQSMCIT